MSQGQIIYEVVDGHPMPRLPMVAGNYLRPDNKRFFDLQGASKRFGLPVERLKRNWLATWQGVFNDDPAPDAPADPATLAAEALAPVADPEPESEPDPLDVFNDEEPETGILIRDEDGDLLAYVQGLPYRHMDDARDLAGRIMDDETYLATAIELHLSGVVDLRKVWNLRRGETGEVESTG